jgi:hypothetical protein
MSQCFVGLFAKILSKWLRDKKEKGIGFKNHMPLTCD